jgi:hypothetical protein
MFSLGRSVVHAIPTVTEIKLAEALETNLSARGQVGHTAVCPAVTEPDLAARLADHAGIGAELDAEQLLPQLEIVRPDGRVRLRGEREPHRMRQALSEDANLQEGAQLTYLFAFSRNSWLLRLMYKVPGIK